MCLSHLICTKDIRRVSKALGCCENYMLQSMYNNSYYRFMNIKYRSMFIQLIFTNRILKKKQIVLIVQIAELCGNKDNRVFSMIDLG